MERLLDRYPDIKIVISSLWRMDHSMEELKSLVSPKISQRIIDTTRQESSEFLASA